MRLHTPAGLHRLSSPWAVVTDVAETGGNLTGSKYHLCGKLRPRSMVASQLRMRSHSCVEMPSAVAG